MTDSKARENFEGWCRLQNCDDKNLVRNAYGHYEDDSISILYEAWLAGIEFRVRETNNMAVISMEEFNELKRKELIFDEFKLGLITGSNAAQ